jgi:hypothetical protein
MKEEPRPNPRYEEGYDNGEEKFWNYGFLYLDEPICLPDNPDIESMEEEEHDVKVMQLAMLGRKSYDEKKILLGEKVAITGNLMHSHTQYHLTKILIFVKDPDDIKPVH